VSGDSWKNKKCDALRSHAAIYKVEVAAALWCGVPPEEVDAVIEESNPTGHTSLASAILRHPEVECLEVYCRAIFEAMDEGVLCYTYEDGRDLDGYAAYGRRHVKRGALKEWIAKEYPSDKPNFLFDEIDQQTHGAITVETFQALSAERDALQAKLKEARGYYAELLKKNRRLEDAATELSKKISSVEDDSGDESESTVSSLMKMVLGMAVQKYKYDPEASRNSATGENKGSIVGDLQASGLSLDADTVRKHLKEASNRFEVHVKR